MVVYAIQHNVTKKIYIGKTSQTGRIRTHFAHLKSHQHSNKYLQADYNEYGDDFSVYLIENVPQGTTDDREAYWMHYFDTANPKCGYNVDDVKAKKADISDFPFYAPALEQEYAERRDSITKEDSQFWRNAVRTKRTGKNLSRAYLTYEAHRDKLGYKDFDVAKACGFGASVLSDWKKGRYTPKADKLARIASYLGFSVEEFFQDE